MKKLALVVLVIAGLYYTGSRSEPDVSAAAPPDHRVAVESLACESVPGGKARASVSIRNAGDSTLEYAQVAVRVGSQTNARYLRPTTLHPDGIGTALVYNTSGGHSPCEVVAVTDRDGYSATLD